MSRCTKSMQKIASLYVFGTYLHCHNRVKCAPCFGFRVWEHIQSSAAQSKRHLQHTDRDSHRDTQQRSGHGKLRTIYKNSPFQRSNKLFQSQAQSKAARTHPIIHDELQRFCSDSMSALPDQPERLNCATREQRWVSFCSFNICSISTFQWKQQLWQCCHFRKPKTKPFVGSTAGARFSEDWHHNMGEA